MKRKAFILILLIIASQGINAQRIDKTINSSWRFHKGDDDATISSLDIEDWDGINLPHTWNAVDAFDDTPGYYRGVGWYAKNLQVPQEWENKSVYIKFEGANQEVKVYLNGNLVGEHVGGYTAFSFNVSEHLTYGEENNLVVRVDNSHNENIPPLNADYTFYGGIYRNVRLIVVEPVHFEMDNYASDGVFVETPEVNENEASVVVHGNVSNTTSDRRRVIVETRILDRNNTVVVEKSSKMVLSPNSKGAFTTEGLGISSPELWHPDHPYLYQVLIHIKDSKSGVVLDQLTLPLGVRWYGFNEEGGFELNGKPLKLIGANRHQDFEDMGNALPDDYHFNDYKRIKELGFNFIRTAHYPQAQEVYRTCDELGLLVWSEIPVVSNITNSGPFFQNSMEMQREHIRQTRNHPSIILYGYMNEIFLGFQYNRSLSEADREKTISATVNLAKQLEELTKTEAPERHSVMALHRSDLYNNSGITDIPDVVGWNLYFGWYYEDLEDLGIFLAEQHELYPTRPMIVSEYGPGTDMHIHAKNPKPWDYSEDYQCMLHASYLKQMMNMPYLAGFAAWNFADFGSERRGDAIPSVNQKGLVNFDRTEKDVVGLYRAYFLEEPVVHIATHNYTQRADVEDSQGAGFSTDSVKVFSNQERITLRLNGTILGEQNVEDFETTFAVPFEEGKNVLTAADGNGNSDKATVNFNLIPYLLNESTSEIREIAVNVGAKVSFFDSKRQVMWIPDRKYTPNSWGFVGGAPYTIQQRQLKTGIDDNILGTNIDPLFQTFVEGLESYRFDVPDGKYVLTLCFQENISEDGADIMYNLNTSNEAEDKSPHIREFDISISGKKVVNGLNLQRDYGSLRAIVFDFTVHAKNGEGIKVDFNAKKGKSTLSGIRIKNLH